MAIHYDLLQRVKTRVYWLGLQDRNGDYIPENRILVLKTEARDKQRVVLEQQSIAFPGIIVFHEEAAERWDVSGSTNRQNLMYFPVYLAIVDTDRGPGGTAGKPLEDADHQLRLDWRHAVNQHFCSQPVDNETDPPICMTNKIQTKMFDFRDWNDDGLWRSLLAFEFGVYIWRDEAISTESLQVGSGSGLLIGDDVGLSIDALTE